MDKILFSDVSKRLPIVQRHARPSRKVNIRINVDEKKRCFTCSLIRVLPSGDSCFKRNTSEPAGLGAGRKGCSDLVPVGPGVYECTPAAIQSL